MDFPHELVASTTTCAPTAGCCAPRPRTWRRECPAQHVPYTVPRLPGPIPCSKLGPGSCCRLAPSGKPLSHYERLATLKALVNKVFAVQYNMQQFLEEQELRLAEDHIAFNAASRIQADKEARELEAKEERLRALDEELELWEAEDHIAFDATSRIQADKNEARELEAQERLCAQDRDNAQYLEQENDELRIQAETKRQMDTVDAAESEMGVLCERVMDVAAAEPEMGMREIDKTASVKIFPVALQDLYNSKSTAADAPMGNTLNEPESARSRPARARTTSAPRTSTSPSTPAPRSRLAPSHASGLTTRSTLRILLAMAFGPFFYIRRAD